MAELQFNKAWEETDPEGKTTVHVAAFEVVVHRGERLTLQYEAVVENGEKTPEDITAEIKEQLGAQRTTQKAATPEHTDLTGEGGLFDTSAKGTFAEGKLDVPDLTPEEAAEVQARTAAQ